MPVVGRKGRGREGELCCLNTQRKFDERYLSSRPLTEMPVLRSSTCNHGSSAMHSSSVSKRPARPQLIRQALERRLGTSDLLSPSPTTSPSTPATSEYDPSESIFRAFLSPSTTPPDTPIPSDFTPMSISTFSGRTRPVSPATPTPTGRKDASEFGLRRTYAKIFSPEGSQMALTSSPTSVSSMEIESERTPRATTSMLNHLHVIGDSLTSAVEGTLFDNSRNVGKGEIEPVYGRMCRMWRFKLTGEYILLLFIVE